MQFWDITRKKIRRRIKILHCINKLLLERIETSKIKIYFIKRKFVWTVNKMTASQNVSRRHKSSASVHPSPDVGHRNGRGLPNRE